jgi:hypothetical protein
VTEEEVRFYADIGGHYDGEPFPDAGTLIVEMPVTLPGTGQVQEIETLYDSVGTTGVIDPSGWVDPTGLLTVDEIKRKLPKHADAGAFVIEDFYPA